MKVIVGEQILKSTTVKVMEEKFNLHVTVHEQPRIQINSSDLLVPINQLFHFLFPHIDASKAIELQTLAYEYEGGKIPKCDLLSRMEDIVGKQILRSAVAKTQKTSTGSSLSHLSI
ncbi:hypothetical protein QL285_029871 [Trifolium repens]|nr:hypothetical protein QL285_029871 [Trifolium repens]